MNEWKFASRKILGSLGGSLTIVLALAIAVGINATIYTLAENFISAGRNDSFFLIGARPVDPKLDYIYMFDTQMLEAVEQNVKSFKSLIRMAPYEFALSNVGRPLMLNGLRVGAGSPDALPVRVMNGRMFAADDFDPAAEKTALITHYAWANAYGRSEDAIGKLIAINGVSHRIIGILPDDFSFHQEKFDLVSASSFREPTYLGLGGPDVWLVGRLRDGVSVEQPSAESMSM